MVRGAKRRILAVVVEANDSHDSVNLGPWAGGSREELVAHLCAGGAFAMMRQRPFDVLANPEDAPRAIYVSGFDSSPLAVSTAVAMEGRMDDLQRGLDALATLAGEGGVHVGVRRGDNALSGLKGVRTTSFDGPHPAGNVGVQIHHTAPINKGEVLWTMGLQDVANLGAYLSTGTYTSASVWWPLRAVGNAQPCRHHRLAGAQLSGLGFRDERGQPRDRWKCLDRNKDPHGGRPWRHRQQVCALPEGHDPLFLLTTGWLSPGLDKFSMSRAYPTWLMPKGKRWKLNTNNNGEERAFVVTGQYERVFPFDIYPVHLIKSIMVGDIDRMEKLGIYEVAPEDFALCEYVCTSKLAVQVIVRKGLDMLRKQNSVKRQRSTFIMKALHKLIEERVKPNFTGEGKLSRFWVVFDSLETFAFTPGHTTKKGVHIRDGIDLKRTMFLVIVAMVPACCSAPGTSVSNTTSAWDITTAESDLLDKLIVGAIKVIPLIVVSYASAWASSSSSRA